MNKYKTPVFVTVLLLIILLSTSYTLKVGFGIPPVDNTASVIHSTPALTTALCTTANPNEYICNGDFELGPNPALVSTYLLFGLVTPGQIPWQSPFPMGLWSNTCNSGSFFADSIPFWCSNATVHLMGKNLSYATAHTKANLPYDLSLDFSPNPPLGSTVDTANMSGTYTGWLSSGSRVAAQLKIPLTPGQQYTVSFDALSYFNNYIVGAPTTPVTTQIFADLSPTYTFNPFNPLIPSNYYDFASPQTILSSSITIGDLYTTPVWHHYSGVFTPTSTMANPTDAYFSVGINPSAVGSSGSNGQETYIDNISIIPYTPPVCSANSWNQKTNFGTAAGTPTGINKVAAASFSIGNVSYVGTGLDTAGTPTNDFWAWDQTTNVWSPKAPFPGVPRSNAVAFSIGTKGYMGTGLNSAGTALNDFWEYDSVANTWTSKANFGGGLRSNAVGLSIGAKGYIGTGINPAVSLNPKFDFWEYTPSATNGPGTWTQKANFGGSTTNTTNGSGLNRMSAVGFSIGTGTTAKGYVGTGNDGKGQYSDFWEYAPSTTGGLGTWLQKAKFGSPANSNGLPREGATGFSIGTKGYIGTGMTMSNSFPITRTLKQDFWEYTYGSGSMGGSWTTKAVFPGVPRSYTFGFPIGTNKGYIGTGTTTTTAQKDFYEYCQ